MADLRVSLFVLACVVFTLANVAGFAHFMGLTIGKKKYSLLILYSHTNLKKSNYILENGTARQK